MPRLNVELAQDDYDFICRVAEEQKTTKKGAVIHLINAQKLRQERAENVQSLRQERAENVQSLHVPRGRAFAFGSERK